MFTVTGYTDGVSYTATVGDPDGGRMPENQRAGIVTGDPLIIGLLTELDGAPYSVTPTGPGGFVDLSDAASVYGALLAHTTVTSTSGDLPTLVDAPVEGTVY